MEKKVTVSEKNIKLIRNLIMWADFDISFLREIRSYLSELGSRLPFEEEKEYGANLRNMYRLLDKIYKDI